MATLAVVCASLLPTTGAGVSQAGANAATSNSGQGYWLAGADGAVYGFGAAGDFGDVAAAVRQPIAGAASTPSGDGYWLVGSDGGIFSFGDAGFYGSTGAAQPADRGHGLHPDGQRILVRGRRRRHLQ
ncbi:MAG: hypothetical protein ACRDZ3_13360, partial [Acidimicrobiia bacterium]